MVDQKFQMKWGYQKEGGSKEESFFLFQQAKPMSYFVPVIPFYADTTLKERCLG